MLHVVLNCEEHLGYLVEVYGPVWQDELGRIEEHLGHLVEIHGPIWLRNIDSKAGLVITGVDTEVAQYTDWEIVLGDISLK